MTNTASHASNHDPDQRRSFFVKLSAIVVGGIVSVVPAIFGGAFVLTPLFKVKNEDSDADAFTHVGSMSSLVPGGAPQPFRITGTRQDAWTTYSETAIGSVYVHLAEDGTLTAFNATCPHLGCTVDFKPEEQKYICPCHDSAFQLDGARTNDIPPRPLDSLVVEVRNDDEIWVKYERFRAGTSDKIPV